MHIAIIGAGNVGSALGTAWARVGHDIVFGVRDTGRPELVELCDSIGARAVPSVDAPANADVVVLALPWDGAEAAIRGLGDLQGKVVIDCTNPLTMNDGVLGLDRGFSTSGAETVAAWIPQANVVKGMNQVVSELMQDNAGLSSRPVQFIAGDDASSKATVRQLIEEIGFEVFDAGGLEQARNLEPLAMVVINQALIRGAGRDWAFGIVRPADG